MGARQQPEIGLAHAQRRRNALGGQRRAPGDAAGIGGRVALGRNEMAAHARAHAVGADQARRLDFLDAVLGVHAKANASGGRFEIADAGAGADMSLRIVQRRLQQRALQIGAVEKPERRAPAGPCGGKIKARQNCAVPPAADIDGLAAPERRRRAPARARAWREYGRRSARSEIRRRPLRSEPRARGPACACRRAPATGPRRGRQCLRRR